MGRTGLSLSKLAANYADALAAEFGTAGEFILCGEEYGYSVFACAFFLGRIVLFNPSVQCMLQVPGLAASLPTRLQ